LVEETNLTQNVYKLRKVLGELVGEHRYIVTVPGRGYSFVGDIGELRGEGDDL
jgi:DNA-binding winged helix-turn-helix (wHTH) protein